MIQRLAVYCGSASPEDSRYLALARDVGEGLAKRGIGVVYGGGRLGLMGAVASGALEAGGRVNLEPALRAGDALGGHIVQGHVDGVASVASAEPEGDGRRLRFAAGPELLRYVVEKGSVAVQGTSLTVAAVDDDGFEVALIPHTLEVTTLGTLEPGAPVNVEVDVLAKYVEKLIAR